MSPMPPPGPPAGIGLSFFGFSATIASVVISRPATDEAILPTSASPFEEIVPTWAISSEVAGWRSPGHHWSRWPLSDGFRHCNRGNGNGHGRQAGLHRGNPGLGLQRERGSTGSTGAQIPHHKRATTDRGLGWAAQTVRWWRAATATRPERGLG